MTFRRSRGIRSGGVLVIALAAALAAHAADNDPNLTSVVNCGSDNNASTCAECCSGAPGCTIGKISCCPLVGDCTVTNKPTGSPPLKLNAQIGGAKFNFQRKIGDDGTVAIKLKAGFLKGVFRKGLSLKASLTGADARISGLLLPVLLLGTGPSSIVSLQNAGYDVALAGELPECTLLFPAQVCGEMATGLSKTLHGMLVVGNREEAADFLTGVEAFGWGPCQFIP